MIKVATFRLPGDTRARWLVLASIAAGAGTILAGVGLMATSGYLISRAAARPPILDLMIVFVAVRFFGLLRPALRYAERLASHDLTFRILLNIRRWFYEALLPLSPARLMAFRSGDLLNRVAADVESLQDVYLRLTAPTIVALVVSGVVLSGLAIVDVRLALVVLALFLLNGIACPLIARRLARGLGVRRNQERGELASHFVLVVQGLEDALAFGHEPAALARARAHQQALDVIEERYGQRLAANAALGSLLSNLGLWSALALTVSAATAGEMPAVWIAALVLGILAAFEAVEPLPNAWQFRDQIEDAARRVSDVIDTTPAVSDPVDATALSIRSAPSVEFDAVTFAYEDRPVLRDLSIRIAPGEHVAIVGPTGSGKSTLLRLLMRAWDPTSGCVRLNGIDLRKARLRELRSALGVMPQQIHVFNETLRDNVRLARPSASDREIADVVRGAGLGAFLSGLPQGLDTFLGEHGARMSAGERQRLALARLLLTDVPVVLVDEPTANLDAETERAVFQVLSEWARDRTMLLVTHRVASLPPVDRVLILDRGTFQASLC